MASKLLFTLCLTLLVLRGEAHAQDSARELVLAKYVVAYNALRIEVEYERRLEKRNAQMAALWRIPSIGDIDSYYEAEKYKQEFLGMEIYVVYPFGMHLNPYVVGIGDSSCIVRIAGFRERVHASGDTSTFRYDNDPIAVQRLGLNKASKDSIDLFVERAISVLAANPSGIILDSNSYQIIDNEIVGEARTRESEFADPRRWKYRIPDSGVLQFEIVYDQE